MGKSGLDRLLNQISKGVKIQLKVDFERVKNASLGFFKDFQKVEWICD